MRLPRVRYLELIKSLPATGYATLPEYEHSAEWRQTREDRYQQDAPRGKYKCVGCGVRHGLQLHHKNYKRLGKERYSDLEWRCDEDHLAIHLKWLKMEKWGFWGMLFFS